MGFARDGMRTMGCPRSKLHDGTRAMEFAQFRTMEFAHDGICTIEFARWNAHDGMRTMEVAQWNLRDGIHTMEFAQ